MNLKQYLHEVVCSANGALNSHTKKIMYIRYVLLVQKNKW